MTKQQKIILIAAIVLVLAGLGWYSWNNRDEQEQPAQNQEARDFSAEGLLLRNEPGLKSDTWFLNYDQAGQSGLLAELVFREGSTCTNGELTGSCDQPTFSQRQRVRVEGKLEGQTVAVDNISDLKGGDLNNPDASALPFQESKVYGFFGTLTLNGHLKIERRVCNPGDMCGETVEYASFVFDKADNPAIYDMLNLFSGNSYLGQGSVGIGCYQKENSRIYSTNDADTGVKENVIMGSQLRSLLASSEREPVKLKMTKPIYTSGRGAPDCYSHFRDFLVVE